MLTKTQQTAPPWQVAEPGYYAEYKITLTGGQRYETPLSPKRIIQSPTKPAGNWWGPFHCADCADVCANFGKTTAQAYDFNHGSPDEKFCTFLTAC